MDIDTPREFMHRVAYALEKYPCMKKAEFGMCEPERGHSFQMDISLPSGNDVSPLETLCVKMKLYTRYWGTTETYIPFEDETFFSIESIHEIREENGDIKDRFYSINSRQFSDCQLDLDTVLRIIRNSISNTMLKSTPLYEYMKDFLEGK